MMEAVATETAAAATPGDDAIRLSLCVCCSAGHIWQQRYSKSRTVLFLKRIEICRCLK